MLKGSLGLDVISYDSLSYQLSKNHQFVQLVGFFKTARRETESSARFSSPKGLAEVRIPAAGPLGELSLKALRPLEVTCPWSNILERSCKAASFCNQSLKHPRL